MEWLGNVLRWGAVGAWPVSWLNVGGGRLSGGVKTHAPVIVLSYEKGVPILARAPDCRHD